MKWHWPHHPSSTDARSAGASAARVLILADDRRIAGEIADILLEVGHWVRCVSTVKAAVAASLVATFDILIVSPILADGTAHDLLREVSPVHPLRAIALAGSGAADATRHDPQFVAHLKVPPVARDVVSAVARASEGLHAPSPVLAG